MLERIGLETIRLVLHEALGGASAIEVEADGFRPWPALASAAGDMAGEGRVLRIRISGWGTAFEAMSIRKQILCDLRLDRDDLARSVLDQTCLLVRRQSRQRARAAVLGISAPLGEEEFCDLRRLRIDLACARALISLFGSDEAVAEWMRGELLTIARRRVGGSHADFRVHGLRIAIPFALAPMQLMRAPVATRGRPFWIDEDVGALADDHETCRDLDEGGPRTLQGTGLEGRSIRRVEDWPPIGLTDLLARQRPEAIDEDPSAFSHPAASERRYAIEPLLIGVEEAFG